MQWVTALKCLQLLPNGLGGIVMSTDFMHRQVRRDFTVKFGFPAWFPTALGLYKITQAALNWASNGLYTHVAQYMFAFQLGGASFVHAVCSPAATCSNKIRQHDDSAL